MTMHILGADHDVCIHGPLRFWAERGLIHVEDARDNSYDVMSVSSAAHRVQAHIDMLANSREQMRRTGFMDYAEYNRLQRMIEQMTEIIRKAQIQGQPTDESAVRDLRRRQPKSVLMPGGAAIL